MSIIISKLASILKHNLLPCPLFSEHFPKLDSQTLLAAWSTLMSIGINSGSQTCFPNIFLSLTPLLLPTTSSRAGWCSKTYHLIAKIFTRFTFSHISHKKIILAIRVCASHYTYDFDHTIFLHVFLYQIYKHCCLSCFVLWHDATNRCNGSTENDDPQLSWS